MSEVFEDQVDTKLNKCCKNESDNESSKTNSNSPSIQGRITEIMTKLPMEIREAYHSQKRIHFISEMDQILNQEEESIYFGQVFNQLKQGTGLQIWIQEKNLLEGTWSNDQVNGQCRMLYSNGDIFECNFDNGKANGFGYFQSKSKIVKGIWRDNLLQGEGVETKKNGEKYLGQFKNGKKCGKGLIYFKDDCKYEGEMKNNKQNGYGTMTWNDGSYLSGIFKNGLIDGSGSYVNSNGLMMNGKFKEIQQQKNNRLQRIEFINEQSQTLTIEKVRLYSYQ